MNHERAKTYSGIGALLGAHLDDSGMTCARFLETIGADLHRNQLTRWRRGDIPDRWIPSILREIGAPKGTALELLAERLGLPPDSVLWVVKSVAERPVVRSVMYRTTALALETTDEVIGAWADLIRADA